MRAADVWGKKEEKEEGREGMTAIFGKKFPLRLTKVTSTHENCRMDKVRQPSLALACLVESIREPKLKRSRSPATF